MCEESGPKDGDMLENRVPLHSTFPSKVGSYKTLVVTAISHISTQVFQIKLKPIYLKCFGHSGCTPAAKPA